MKFTTTENLDAATAADLRSRVVQFEAEWLRNRAKAEEAEAQGKDPVQYLRNMDAIDAAHDPLVVTVMALEESAGVPEDERLRVIGEEPPETAEARKAAIAAADAAEEARLAAEEAAAQEAADAAEEARLAAEEARLGAVRAAAEQAEREAEAAREQAEAARAAAEEAERALREARAEIAKTDEVLNEEAAPAPLEG